MVTVAPAVISHVGTRDFAHRVDKANGLQSYSPLNPPRSIVPNGRGVAVPCPKREKSP